MTYIVEDVIYYVCRTDISLVFCSSFILAQVSILKTYVYYDKLIGGDKYLHKTCSTATLTTKRRDIIHRFEGRTLSSNVVALCAAQMRKDG